MSVASFVQPVSVHTLAGNAMQLNHAVMAVSHAAGIVCAVIGSHMSETQVLAPASVAQLASFAQYDLHAPAAPVDAAGVELLLQPTEIIVSRAAAKQVYKLFTLSSCGAVAPRFAGSATKKSPAF